MSRYRVGARFCALLIACLILIPVATAIGQTGAVSEDPVTGKWGKDGLTFLDLKYDGKRSVSGTTIWREGTSIERRAPIRTGTFDPKTATLKLEGVATRPDGVEVSYVIEGRIEDDTVSGTFKFGDSGGEFTFKRQLGRDDPRGRLLRNPAVQEARDQTWQQDPPC